MPPNLLSDDVQAQERISQMVEDSHEENEVPLPVHAGEVIDLAALEAAGIAQAQPIGRPSRLGKEMRVAVDSENLCASPCKFEAVKPCVAANVENPPSTQICRQMRGQLLPFPVGKNTEMMVGKGLDRVGKVDVMEPGTQASDVVEDTLVIHKNSFHAVI